MILVHEGEQMEESGKSNKARKALGQISTGRYDLEAEDEAVVEFW